MWEANSQGYMPFLLQGTLQWNILNNFHEDIFQMLFSISGWKWKYLNIFMANQIKTVKLVNNVLCNETSKKTQNDSVQSACRLVGQSASIGCCVGLQSLWRQKFLSLDLVLCICSSHCWFIFSNNLCNKPVIYWANWFLEFCEVLHQINQTQEVGCGNLWFIANWSETQVTTWTSIWHLTLGQSWGLSL